MTMTKARVRRPTNVAPLTHLQSVTTAVWPDDVPVLAQVDDWCVYPDSTLQRWEVYVDEAQMRTFVSQETWDTIAWDGHAQDLFEREYVGKDGVCGMQFIVASAAPWVTAARKESVAAGTNVPEKKDRLQEISEKAQGLLLQAASLNTAATRGQAVTFNVRYAKLAADLAALEAEVAQARSLVDLAATAVLDASS